MAQAAKLLVKTPISNAGCGDIRIVTNGYDLTVQYEYWSEASESNRKSVGTLRFKGVSAFRFRDEMRSAGFAQASFDSLVEVLDSGWRKHLLEIEPDHIRDSIEQKHHYAILLSSNGYLEVIADNFEELPEYEGSLQSE